MDKSNQTLSVEQALQILDQATAAIQANRAQHQMILLALEALKKALNVKNISSKDTNTAPL